MSTDFNAMFDEFMRSGRGQEVNDKAEAVGREITEFLKDKCPDLDPPARAHALSIGCVLAAAEQIASFVKDPTMVLLGSNLAAKILVAASMLKHGERGKPEEEVAQ